MDVFAHVHHHETSYHTNSTGKSKSNFNYYNINYLSKILNHYSKNIIIADDWEPSCIATTCLAACPHVITTIIRKGQIEIIVPNEDLSKMAFMSMIPI